MGKFSLDFKKQVSEHYLNGEEGYLLTARRFNIKDTYVRRWVMRYRLHGIEGLKGGPRAYSKEFKLKVIKYKKEHGLSQQETAAKFNILSTWALSNWEKRYNEGGEKALYPKQKDYYNAMFKLTKSKKEEKPDEEKTQKELIAELNYARLEIAYLKKLEALIQKKKLAQKKKRK